MRPARRFKAYGWPHDGQCRYLPCWSVEPRVGANAPAFARGTVAKGCLGRLLGGLVWAASLRRSGGAGIWWRCPLVRSQGLRWKCRSPCRMEGVALSSSEHDLRATGAGLGKPPYPECREALWARAWRRAAGPDQLWFDCCWHALHLPGPRSSLTGAVGPRGGASPPGRHLPVGLGSSLRP